MNPRGLGPQGLRNIKLQGTYRTQPPVNSRGLGHEGLRNIMFQGTCRTQTPVKQEFWPSCQKHQRSSILSGSLHVKKVVCPNHENMTDKHARLALGGKAGFALYIYIYISANIPSRGLRAGQFFPKCVNSRGFEHLAGEGQFAVFLINRGPPV